MFEQWIPLLVAIFGGVGVKLIETMITRSGHRIDEQAQIRKELRDVVENQDRKITELIAELDKWKQKYYELLEDMVGYEELKLKYKELQEENNRLIS